MKRVVTLACLCLASFNCEISPAPSSGQLQIREEDAEVIGELRVAKGGDALILSVRTMGRELPFLLDTGCTSNHFDTGLTQSLRQIGTVRSRSFSGIAVSNLFEAPSATLGSMAINQGSGILAQPFEQFSEGLGRSICGILGMSHLRQHIVEINFDQGVVRFLKEKSLAPGEALDLIYDHGCPAINALFGDMELQRVCIDTGFSGELHMEAGDYDLMVLEKKLKESKTARSVSIDVNGRQVRRKGQLGQLTVGPFVHRDVTTYRSKKINAVGLAYLSRYLVTFDFPNNKLYLKPGLSFNRKSWSDAVGIGFILRKNEILIEEVTKNSPAAEAGIEMGDVLLEVDGRDARKSSLFELRVMFTHVGEKYRLTVRRGDDVRTHELHLRELE